MASFLRQIAAANETIVKQREESVKQREESVKEREESVKQREETLKHQKKETSEAKLKQLLTRSGKWSPFKDYITKLVEDLETSEKRVIKLEEEKEQEKQRNQYSIQMPETTSDPRPQDEATADVVQGVMQNCRSRNHSTVQYGRRYSRVYTAWSGKRLHAPSNNHKGK